LSPH
jgi:hypothetical protein